VEVGFGVDLDVVEVEVVAVGAFVAVGSLVVFGAVLLGSASVVGSVATEEPSVVVGFESPDSVGFTKPFVSLISVSE
jgi:hypothetical protein